MKIFIGQIALLFSLSSLLYATDYPTNSIDQPLNKPKVKDGVYEIKEEHKIKDINSNKLNKFRPQKRDELFRCDDVNSMDTHNGPVCARRVEKVVCFRAPCPWPTRWISYPNPKEACAASNITDYALGNCIYKEMDSDLEMFKAQAISAICSNLNNRLFLIDNKLVFWRVEGSCPDSSYGLILYDKSSHQILCSLRDSIAGPMRTINDQQYESLFNVITQNLENPNLGLSLDHTVEEIPLTD